TSIHQPKEAMELAHFVKELVPRAQVFGTSTSAVINGGKLENSQCIVSVTQMDDGRLKTALLPVTDPTTGQTIPAKTLCENVKEAVITEDTKLCLAFITGDYKDVNFFANETNESFPGVQMIGGVAAGNIDKKTHADTYGFLFTENGWSKSGLLVTSFSGNDLECFSSYVSGVQPVGKEMEVTETQGNCVVSLDGRDALGEYLSGVGRGDQEIADLTRLLPFVYSDDDGLPVQPIVKNDKLYLTHNVAPGRKIRRSFFYDREIISLSLHPRLASDGYEVWEESDEEVGYKPFEGLPENYGIKLIGNDCVLWIGEYYAYEGREYVYGELYMSEENYVVFLMIRGQQ
ncbi:MAG: hypothetical protein II568_03230, partial [Erysipelotrichaceae bacterium]|nr:hypothetical protein [Erysipelotrichaceae bacterium]